MPWINSFRVVAESVAEFLVPRSTSSKLGPVAAVIACFAAPAISLTSLPALRNAEGGIGKDSVTPSDLVFVLGREIVFLQPLFPLVGVFVAIQFQLFPLGTAVLQVDVAIV
jgi:hypothetical protein